MIELRVNDGHTEVWNDGEKLPSVTEIVSVLRGQISLPKFVIPYARRGGAVHHYLAEWERGVDINTISHLDIEHELALQYCMSWINKRAELGIDDKTVIVERTVHTLAPLPLAGTIDISFTANDKAILADFKTGDEPDIFFRYQMEMYAMIENKVYDEFWKIALNKDGSPAEIISYPMDMEIRSGIPHLYNVYLQQKKWGVRK